MSTIVTRITLRPARAGRKAGITGNKLNQLVFLLQEFWPQTAGQSLDRQIQNLGQRLDPRFTERELKAAITWALIGQQDDEVCYEKVHADSWSEIFRDPVSVIVEMGCEFDQWLLKGLQQLSLPEDGVCPGHIERDPEAARRTASVILGDVTEIFGGLLVQADINKSIEQREVAFSEVARIEVAA